MDQENGELKQEDAGMVPGKNDVPAKKAIGLGKKPPGKKIDAAKWAEVKYAYMTGGILSPKKLSETFDIGYSTIQKRMADEKWRLELRKIYTRKQLKTMGYRSTLPGNRDEHENSITLDQSISEKKEDAQKTLISSATLLLKKIKDRISVTGHNDLSDIVKEIDALQTLYDMLQGMMAFGNMGNKPGAFGKPSRGSTGNIKLTVLTQVVEQADQQNMRDAERRKPIEIKGPFIAGNVSDVNSGKESENKGLTDGRQ